MFHASSPQLANVFGRIAEALEVTPFTQPRDESLSSIFLCMTPRSGSSYLGSVLHANRIGRFGEHFRIMGGSLEKSIDMCGAKTYEDYVRGRIAALRQRDVFGAKVDWLQFAPLYYLGAYDHYFRDAKYIYLTREDLMAQAVSRYIATETGYFHSVQNLEHTTSMEVPLDFDRLWRHAEHLVGMLAAWETFFAVEGISPLRITYEALEADPAAVMRRISAHVGIPLRKRVVTDTAYKKVRNDRHERMRSYAVEEARRRRLASPPILGPASKQAAE